MADVFLDRIRYLRFQVLTAASMKFRIVIPDDGGSTYLWNVGRYYFTRQYIPEYNSEKDTLLLDSKEGIWSQ